MSNSHSTGPVPLAPRRLTRAALATGVRHLCAIEPGFRRTLRAHGPPPLWSRRPGFATLLQIILEQQVSLASAASLLGRLRQELGAIEPQTVVRCGEAGLRALGLTRQKAGYWIAIAEAVCAGRLDFGSIARADDLTARAQLTALRGVGPWTAEIYQLMALRRPDIWPTGDLALLVALQSLHALAERPDNARAAALTAAWSPWRSVGARLLWHAYLNRGRGGSAS